MNTAEYAQFMASTMSEAQLQACIVAAAQRHGWLVYHTHDSRRSQPGFPDLVLLHPRTGATLWRELKTQKGKLRPEQRTWLNALWSAGHDAAIWRPLDWFNGTIPDVLDLGDEPTVQEVAPW